jgi:formiminoglutamase
MKKGEIKNFPFFCPIYLNMDLKLFLDPVSESCLDDSLGVDSFQNAIFVNTEVSYELEGIDIAILGITDYRGVTDNLINSDAPDLIRNKLYHLSKTSGRNRILDLGNLRNGPTIDDTRLRLKEVVNHLLTHGIFPVIVGGSHDLDVGQYAGYDGLDKLVTLLNVDSRIDFNPEAPPCRSHTSKILRYDPNYLFNYIHMGYQGYLVPGSELEMLQKLNFESYRLGDIREDLEELEPIIRDADLVSFDASAIQSIYCPNVVSPNVFGLTGEEACQICWYAGLNDKLSSFGIYDFFPDKNVQDPNTAMVIATMIWYLIEGFYNRKGDRNMLTNDYLVYEVALGGNPDSIRFYKSKLSEKWWMEVPDDEETSVFLRKKMIACSYSDYEMATSGEVPQRWINALSRQ